MLAYAGLHGADDESLESFYDWGGRRCDDSVPERSPKQPLPGIGLHDSLHGRQAYPELNSFITGLVKYIPGRDYFGAVPSQNRDKFETSPTPLIVEQLLGM